MAQSGVRRLSLQPHPHLLRGKPLLVCILDGWGEGKVDNFNAVHVANTPTIDSLRKISNRWRLLKAHGPAVGLPSEDDMGNSEVGHNALGAGRIYKQGAALVDSAIANGKIFLGDGFRYIQTAFESHTLHLLGLLSDGGVHSRYDQLLGFMKGAVEHGAKRIRLHILTDGRDVPDGSSFEYVSRLEGDLAELRESHGCDARIASGGGRMHVTMDRYDSDWNVVERGWHTHVLGDAPHKFKSATESLTKLREADPEHCNDQYYPPWVIVDSDRKPVGPIEDGDAVVTFNFRADRMVMISKAFEIDDFSSFDRVRRPSVKFAGMMQYDGELKLPLHFLVAPPEIERTSGEYLVSAGVRTFACSESVKFGHVTFFWNGNRSGKLSEELEEYREIRGDAGIQFNQKPTMRAGEIALAAREALLSHKFDQVRINLANGDMVGHTGDLKAVVEGCEAVDKAVKVGLETVEEVGGIFLVTSDHGNAEEMAQRDKKTGAPLKAKDGTVKALTSHTCAPVPIAIGGPGLPENVKFREDLPDAGLANVAATIINLLGFEAPPDYEPSLLAVGD